MTRFYFNIREGNRLTRDEEGIDLPGLDADTREAEMSGREILADMLRDGTPLDGQAMEITSEEGKVLKQISLKSLFWVGA